jgi:hypothetical protein
MTKLKRLRSNLTIFTTCKPWRGVEVATAQWNALKSWTLLSPRPEIVVYGDEFGSARMAAELGLVHKPSVHTQREGLPYVSALFETAQVEATTPLTCYINADIIMVRGLAEAARVAGEWARGRNFMMVGRRFDVPALAGQAVDMTGDWRDRLEQFAVASGELHGPEALDWFMFRRESVTDIPPLVMGCSAWDNWLLLAAARKGFETIDATDAVFAAHQADSVGRPTVWWQANRRLWEQEEPEHGEGTAAACGWRLDRAMNIIAA